MAEQRKPEWFRNQAAQNRRQGRPYYLPMCRRGAHQEQIHHADYDGCCDCPCHNHRGIPTQFWENGERFI